MGARRYIDTYIYIYILLERGNNEKTFVSQNNALEDDKAFDYLPRWKGSHGGGYRVKLVVLNTVANIDARATASSRDFGKTESDKVYRIIKFRQGNMYYYRDVYRARASFIYIYIHTYFACITCVQHA